MGIATKMINNFYLSSNIVFSAFPKNLADVDFLDLLLNFLDSNSTLFMINLYGIKTEK